MVDPYMIRYYGCMLNEKKLIIVMESFGDCDLFDYINPPGGGKKTKPTANQTLQIMAQLVENLQTLHDHNIIHNDIKLDNIRIDTSNPDKPIAKILDYGISCVFKPVKDPLTQKPSGANCGTCGKVGTPYYIDHEITRTKCNVINYFIADWRAMAQTFYAIIHGCFYTYRSKSPLIYDCYAKLHDPIVQMMTGSHAARMAVLGSDTREWGKLLTDHITKILEEEN